MCQTPQDFGLEFESLKQVRADHFRSNDLYSDVAIRVLLPGQVDQAHAALTQHPFDLILTDAPRQFRFRKGIKLKPDTLGDLVFGKLSPKGFAEIDRRNILTPTRDQLNRRGGVCWTHPAFASGHVIVRNDEKLVCADLRKKD